MLWGSGLCFFLGFLLFRIASFLKEKRWLRDLELSKKILQPMQKALRWRADKICISSAEIVDSFCCSYQLAAFLFGLLLYKK